LPAWLFAPVWRRHRAAQAHHDHDHGHGGHHHHGRHDHDDDAHARYHAEQISRRFGDGQATTGQIILFGLTGGLIPCPAAITVLLICLQLREFTLGVALVLCFSIGLAITLTASGVVAALGVRHLSKRGIGFEKLMARAPYLSALLILVIAAYMGWHGMVSLAG
jgi:nickel/cobalt exporter